jgi:hypothetical protein
MITFGIWEKLVHVGLAQKYILIMLEIEMLPVWSTWTHLKLWRFGTWFLCSTIGK